MKAESSSLVTLPDLLAGLQLNHYIVDDLVFKCNASAEERSEQLDPPYISVDFDVKENANDKNQFLLEMVIDLNKDQEMTKFEIYQIHLHLYGWFSFTAELDKQTRAKMLATNASAMLYGVARSIVADLTGSLGPERFILPTLNLLAVVKAKAAKAREAAATAKAEIKN